MGEYREWAIRVTPRLRNDEWTATVEVWPPETDRRHIHAYVVAFSGSSRDMETLIASGMATARRYIDAAR